MELLDLSVCTSAELVREAIAQRVKSVPLTEVLKNFKKEFYNASQVIEFLYVSVTSGSNGILHGPGGFGKSKITEAFFKYFNIPVNVIVGYHDMDVEGLLGLPDMKKLMEESEYITAFEKSVFNKPGILILEEFMDVRPSTAAALKDILTEGGLRQGGKLVPSFAGQTFICSNKDPEEMSVDLSTAAFYKERFPCSLFVAWEKYEALDYAGLLKVLYPRDYPKYNDAYNVLGKLCAKSCSDKNIISPRIVIAARNVMINTGISGLKFINELDTSILDEVQYELIQITKKNRLVEMVTETLPALDQLDPNRMSMTEKVDARAQLSYLQNTINKITLTDDLLEVMIPYNKTLEETIFELDRYIFIPTSENKYEEMFNYEKIQKLSNNISS